MRTHAFPLCLEILIEVIPDLPYFFRFHCSGPHVHSVSLNTNTWAARGGKSKEVSLESYDDDESADTAVGWFLQLSQLLRDSHRINTLLESAAVGVFVSHFIHYPYTEKQRKRTLNRLFILVFLQISLCKLRFVDSLWKSQKWERKRKSDSHAFKLIASQRIKLKVGETVPIGLRVICTTHKKLWFFFAQILEKKHTIRCETSS